MKRIFLLFLLSSSYTILSMNTQQIEINAKSDEAEYIMPPFGPMLIESQQIDAELDELKRTLEGLKRTKEEFLRD